MTENKPIHDLLKEMISAPGLSGYEAPVRSIIESAWRPLTDELSVTRLGSLHGLRRGSGSEPRPSLLLAAHMDAIGMMVTSIVEGFLHITGIGGLDPRVLPGQPVTVLVDDDGQRSECIEGNNRGIIRQAGCVREM